MQMCTLINKCPGKFFKFTTSGVICFYHDHNQLLKTVNIQKTKILYTEVQIIFMLLKIKITIIKDRDSLISF